MSRLLRLLRRSTAIRLTTAVMGLFVMVFLAAFAAAWMRIGDELEDRERAALEDVATSLAGILARAGPEGLKAELQAMEAVAAQSGLLLSWSVDGAVFGNTTLDQPLQGWRHVDRYALETTADKGEADYFYALGVPLGEGDLVVARGADAVDEVREIFGGALALGLGCALALSVFGAIALALRTEARIAALSAVLDAVAAGNLDRRAPVIGKGDDLDRTAAAVNVMLERLAANVASLRQVSADIAHDLKTPIQRLRNVMEAFSRRPGLDAAAVARVEEALAQADDIVRIFDAMLRIAQIEAGGARVRFRIVDLTELARAVADAFGPVAEEAGHRFEARLAEDALAVGDRDLLAQVLINLIENAVRHCPPAATIILGLAADARGTTFTVTDDGPGVPAPERDKVLRRFYRLERSRTTEGSGLGLSLVAAIADLHGGRLTLQDAGPGLRVSLHLPPAP